MRDSRGPKRCVVVLSLAAIALLAAAVCALHWVNAVSLRGTVSGSDYVLLARDPEPLAVEGLWTDASVYADGESRFALLMENPTLEDGLLRISGALLRLDQPTGEVRLRVALIPADAEDAATSPQTCILLNTQMVRREDVAWCGYDDHCGFCATAAQRLLEDGQYAVALVDESDGARRLVNTGVGVMISKDGLAVERMSDANEEGGA